MSINCPVAQLLNLSSLAVVSKAGSGSALGTRAGYGASSVGSPTTLSTLKGSRGRKAHKLNPIPEVVAIMQELRAKRTGVYMNTVMRSEKLGIAEVGIGGGERA